MSRKGEVWRGELAQRIEEYLNGTLPAGDLLDWALDHPFFEDQQELSEDDQHIIAQALAGILQMSEDEPPAARTTPDQFSALIDLLWRDTPHN